MYEYLEGTLVESQAGYTVIDVRGIGYRLLTPRSLGSIGERVKVYTSFVVREQSQTLFGFSDQEERSLFELLISLSGIGPKTALAIIGHVENLYSCVQEQNVMALATVPGIGKKTAERLLVDLKGRLKGVGPVHGLKLQDALAALLNLGYSQAAAEKAVQQAAKQVSDPTDLAQLITTALKF